MNSTDDTVGWTSEPKGRGTSGLLWSCFATIFLCTWNAIHPNIPQQSDNELSILARRVRYLLACLLAPEWFAVMAVDRFTDARKLQSMVGQAATHLAPS
jgi:hypothetical protein